MRLMRHAAVAVVALPALAAAGCAGRMISADGEAGFARIECAVTSSGHPADCRVLTEAPAGMGFGAAALEIVQRGRLSAGTVKGTRPGAKFVVRVPFFSPADPSRQVQAPVEGRRDRP